MEHFQFRATGIHSKTYREAARAGSLTASNVHKDNEFYRLWLVASMSLAWGANWPFIRIAVSEIPVFTLRFTALATGAVGLFVLAYFQNAQLRLSRREILPLCVAALGNVTLWHFFSAVGVLYMGAGHASILGFTMPLWIAFIGAAWGKEKISKLHLVGLILGMAGLACLLYPDWHTIWLHPWGPLSMIMGAISWAFGTVAMRRFRFSAPVVSITAWQLALGALPLLPGALLFERQFSFANTHWPALLSLAYMGLIATIYGNWAWFQVVSIYPAVIAGISSLAIPIIGVLSGAILLGEPLGFPEIGALLFICAALVLVLILPRVNDYRQFLARSTASSKRLSK